jgi:CubicO group peptidase (beta-lactamase class C family)
LEGARTRNCSCRWLQHLLSGLSPPELLRRRYADQVCVKGYGIATFPSTPVTADTLFFTGSTTKAFTAAGLSFLVEDDENYPGVKWDTPINQLIGDDFVLEDEWYTNHVTLEDAGSHRSGLPRHDFSYGGVNTTAKDYVRGMRYLPLTAPIRTEFQYCNLMYITLGYVIEALTSTKLGAFLHDRIWAPLNMTSTTFCLKCAEDTGDLATGYTVIDSRIEPRFASLPYLDESAMGGAGGTISTVNDYTKWIRAMIDQSPPLSKAQYRAITTPRIIIPQIEPPPGFPAPPFTGPGLYALGWGQSIYRGEVIWEHGGGLPGFGTQLIIIPSRNYGVVTMGNIAGASNEAGMILAWELIDDFLDVPASERFNYTEVFRKGEELGKVFLDNFKYIVFPDIPDPPIPHSRPLEAYTGLYYNPGYHTLNLTLRYPANDTSIPSHPRRESRRPRSHLSSTSNPTPFLHGQPSPHPWEIVYHLTHVTGEYFFGDAIDPWPASANVTAEDGLDPEGETIAKGPAIFKVAASGEVVRLGVPLEPVLAVKQVMAGKAWTDEAGMIWFDKIG